MGSVPARYTHMSARRSCTRTTSLLLIVLIPLGSASAMGQTRSAPDQPLEAALRPGMTVWITDSAGRDEHARVVGVSHGVVTTSSGDRIRHTRISDVVRVSTPHFDSILNGALIGAGVAVACGLFLCRRTELWENCRDDAGPIAGIAALGAAIGIDRRSGSRAENDIRSRSRDDATANHTDCR
jgi:hypothetical protein